MQQSLDGMLEPSLIGDMVLHAVQENEFWILSHPEFREGTQARAQGISDAFDRWEAFRTDYDK
ncbi:MAG: hypothetical protein HOF53_19470 [Gammaproteobacteria bacterium]|jgi:hypothetical protein|nr:hypothetical protein [Gammaproteobacteria bacterium]